MDIREALASLDATDDSLWTEGGMPKVSVIRELTENNSLERRDITDAAPQFTRDNPVVEIEEEDEEGGEEDAEEKEEEVINVDDLPVDSVEFYKVVQSMTREEAEAAAQAVSQILSEYKEAARDLQKEMDRLSINLQNAKQRVAALTPRNQNQMDIMAHIRKQNELRAQRAGVSRAAREKLGLADISMDPRSPIDQAMARKTGRGKQRPTRI